VPPSYLYAPEAFPQLWFLAWRAICYEVHIDEYTDKLIAEITKDFILQYWIGRWGAY
jgi:hypothetical protein